MSQKYLLSIFIIASTLLVFTVARADWDPPTADPPGDNTYKPINQGEFMQVKDGTLWLGGENYAANPGDWGFLVEQGRVGIGKTSPGAGLDLRNESSGIPIFRADSAGGTERFRITDDGDVGIGVTDPSYRLDVAGEANFEQPIYVGAPWEDDHAATKNYVDSELEEATTTAEDLYVNEAGDSMSGGLGIGYAQPGSTGLHISGNVGIGTDSPDSSLHIDATDALRIPAGSTAERPAEITGMVRYNTEINTFEGYDGSNWTGLGGVIDANQDTYIIPETSSGSNEDTLYFHTDGPEEMRLTTDGRLGIGATDPSYRLDVAGEANFEQPIYVGAPWEDDHAATKNYVDSELEEATTTAEDLYVNEVGDSMSGGLGIGYAQPGSTGLHISGNVGIGTDSPDSSLHIDATDALRIPAGSTAERPAEITGMMRYNTEINTFEGYDGSNWSGLGGVIDADQNTYIEPETSSGADENTLFFHTDGAEEMRLTTDGRLGIGTTDPSYRLDVAGEANFEQPIYVGAPWQDDHAATKNYVDSEIGSATTTGIWGTNGDDIYNINSGNVGVGTSTPEEKLHVTGNIEVPTVNDICIEDYACLSDILGGYKQRTANGTGEVSRSCEGEESIVSASVQFEGGHTTSFGYVDVDFLDDSASVDCGEDTCTLYLLCSPGTAADVGYWERIDNDLYYNMGEVGIGTSDPSYDLDVAGEANFSQPIYVGAPWEDDHAATKNYVDSNISDTEDVYVDESGDSMTGNLDMSSNDITGVNKLTVTTVDPVFKVNDKKYATYVGDTAGGVKIETQGISELGEDKSHTFDFNDLEEGSDLWLFWQASNQQVEDFVLNLTPRGSDPSVSLSYDVRPEEEELVVYGTKDTEFSWRIIADRVDAEEWDTEVDDDVKENIDLSDYR